MLDKPLEEVSKFTLMPRRSLIVWVYSLRQLKNLRRFGIVSHVSRKMKYVIIYMNESDIEKNCEAIAKLHFVRSVDLSLRPDVAMDFDQRIGSKEALLIEDDGFEVEELSAKIVLTTEV